MEQPFPLITFSTGPTQKDNFALLVVAAAGGDFIILVWFGFKKNTGQTVLCHLVVAEVTYVPKP